MNYKIHFFSFLLIFLFFNVLCTAQQATINGQVFDEDGNPVTGVKVSLGKGFELTDKDGNFVANVESDIEDIQLFKRGYALKNWKKETGENGETFLKIFTRFTEFDLLGKAFDEYGKPLLNTQIVLSSADPKITVNTNNKGIFSMHIPSYVRVNKESKFLVAGRKVEPDGISFEEKGGILNIALPVKMQKLIFFNASSERIANMPIGINNETYTTNESGEISARLGDKQDNRFEAKNLEVQEVKYLPADQLIMVYMKEAIQNEAIDESLTNSDKSTSENSLAEEDVIENIVEEYGKDFNYIINELELEKQMLIERSSQLRAEMEKVAEKMSKEDELTTEEQETLNNYMGELETQLIENDVAYEDAQVKTKEIIDRMKMAMINKDSIYQATEEKLEETVIEKQRIKEKSERDIMIFSIVACSLVAILGVTVVSGKRIKKQRNQLAIVNDQLHAAQAELVKNVEEINKQNKEITQQADNLSALNKEMASKNKKMTDNIRYALTVQKAILPDREYISKYIPNNFLTYLPKDIVSGDFYWFTHVPAKNGSKAKNFIAAVDCTGHGVSGAFMSLIGCTLLNDIVNQRGIYETDKILHELNINVEQQLKQRENASNDGMDVCLCSIEEENGTYTLNYSGAKRPLTYYDSQQKAVKRIKGDRKSVGGKQNLDYHFTRQTLTLQKNDCIYLDSDGFVDQNSTKKEKFGSKKLYGLIAQIADKSMAVQKNIFETALKEHQTTAEQRDDILLMGFRL